MAGTAVRTRAALLYESERVESLAARRHVEAEEMESRTPGGLLVSRRTVRVDVAPGELLDELAAVPQGMSPWTALSIRLRCEHRGPLPYIATVAGCVVLGADVQRVMGDRLLLGPPGDWFDGLADTCFLTGTGRSWTLQEARAWELAPPRIGTRTTA